jgi:hypothetical protein
MRTLRRFQTASLRVAPHWFLCVLLGAYVAMNMVTPAAITI